MPLFSSQRTDEKINYLNTLIEASEARKISIKETNELIELMFKYYLQNNNKDEDETDSITFCINRCPSELPFKTIDNFCTDDSKKLENK